MRSRSFAIIAGLFAVLAGCSKPAVKPAADQPRSVETASALAMGATVQVKATGKLERTREIVLSFRIPGNVRQLTVNNGDSVRKGQLVAAIDATQVSARVAQAQADVAKASRDLARDADLADKGWVSGQRLADRKSVLQVSQAGLKAAQFDLAYARIVAPSSGVVLVRHVQAGETVGAGQPVVTMADMAAPLVARVALVDRDVARVKLGDPARITVSALGGLAIPGVVSRIGERADPRTGATDVEVRVASDARLKTGYVADIAITLRDADASGPDRQRVPAEAILEVSNAKGYVYTIDPATRKARRQAIGFLGFAGDDAIVQGLTPGQRVITFGGALVRDGDVVFDSSSGG